MRSKYIVYVALLPIIVLFFTGCNALITNVFKDANLGQPSAAKIQNQDAATLIQQAGITSGVVSDTFIQAVISNEATKNQVLGTLQGKVDHGTFAEAQAAQALILDIKLADIGADTVMDNLNAVVGQLAALANSSEELKPQDIINALLPAELANNPANLASFINKLAELGTDVDTLAQKIVANNGIVADGLDIATIAQTAALVKFVEIVEPASGYSTGAAIAHAVEDLKNNSNADVTQYFAAQPDIASLADNTTLQTLFDAAGLSTLLDKMKSGS